MAEILAMRQEADQLREQLKVAESQKGEAEANLEAFRIESASKKAEQERYNLAPVSSFAASAFDVMPDAPPQATGGPVCCRDIKRRENLEREVRDLKSAVNARQVELRSRSAEAQSAENALKDYELQIRELHVRAPAARLAQSGETIESISSSGLREQQLWNTMQLAVPTTERSPWVPRRSRRAMWVKNCLKRMQVAANRVNKEYTELANQGNRLQRELDAQTASCAQLSADNSARASALKAAEASLATARADNARLARTAEAAAARLRASEEKRTALEEQREDLRCAPLCRAAYMDLALMRRCRIIGFMPIRKNRSI